MPPNLPLSLQGLSAQLRRRLELAEAAAWEDASETHARQALEMVAVLAPRMPFNEAVDRYTEIMSLGGEEVEPVRNRALVMLSESGAAEELARERPRAGRGLDWRYATPLGAIRFVRRQLRRSAEEDLWMELAAARAEEALIRTHVKHALIFAGLLDQHAAPPRSVSLYLDRLEVPSARARSVYQRTLAELAETQLPRRMLELSPRSAETHPVPSTPAPDHNQ